MRSTPQYNAIEVQQDMKYTKYSDVYSLGLILYDLCYCEKPMAGDIYEWKLVVLDSIKTKKYPNLEKPD